MIPANITARLKQFNQSHLLQFVDQLNQTELNKLTADLESLDFDQLKQLLAEKKSGTSNEESPQTLARKASPLTNVIRQQELSANSKLVDELTRMGNEALRAGKIGAILVAGGQGTRLGFPHPKGIFPVGPISQQPLFQILVEQLLARSRKASHAIPYYIMTSDATHQETLSFLEKHHYFGMNSRDVKFFMQGTMPAAEATTGMVLLAGPGEIALSPDGHGGILQALVNHNLLKDMRDRGIEYLFYHQVDNPTAIVCDPLIIGAHILRNSDMTTKVASKRSWDEKMGILADIDGKTQIIEYSDLPDDIAQQADDKAQLRFWAGNMGIHVFSLSFLERITKGGVQLPFHIAHKKVPFVNTQGELIQPVSPNAFKFERFIFDALLFAENALVVEADRQREFNPVKNATGNDSPETCKQALIQIARNMFIQAGIPVAENIKLEISPLLALDHVELKKHASRLQYINSDTWLRE